MPDEPAARCARRRPTVHLDAAASRDLGGPTSTDRPPVARRPSCRDPGGGSPAGTEVPAAAVRGPPCLTRDVSPPREGEGRSACPRHHRREAGGPGRGSVRGFSTLVLSEGFVRRTSQPSTARGSAAGGGLPSSDDRGALCARGRRPQPAGCARARGPGDIASPRCPPWRVPRSSEGPWSRCGYTASHRPHEQGVSPSCTLPPPPAPRVRTRDRRAARATRLAPEGARTLEGVLQRI